MTTAARRVLDDCKFILAKLEDEKDDQQWRIHWVAVVTLLRAVGHVLTKVDGKREAVRLASIASIATGSRMIPHTKYSVNSSRKNETAL